MHESTLVSWTYLSHQVGCTQEGGCGLSNLSSFAHGGEHQRQLWSMLPSGLVSGRIHNETWAGCIASLTTPTRSSLNASRSVSSRNWAENPLSVLATSNFLL